MHSDHLKSHLVYSPRTRFQMSTLEINSWLFSFASHKYTCRRDSISIPHYFLCVHSIFPSRGLWQCTKKFLGSIFYHLVTQTANKLVPPNLMHQATSKTGWLLKVGAGGGKRRNTNLFLFSVLIYILKTASLLPNAKLLLNSAQPLEILASHVPSQLSVPIPELRLKPTRDYTLSTLVKNKGFSNLVQACTSPTHHMKAEHIVYFF